MEDEKWEKGYCCCCGVEDVLVIKTPKIAGQNNPNIEFHTHCKICYTTNAGDICYFPRQFQEPKVIKIMVQIAHYIIKEIHKN